MIGHVLRILEDLKPGADESELKYALVLRWGFWLSCLMVVVFSLVPPNDLPSFEFQIFPNSWSDMVLHAAAFTGLCLTFTGLCLIGSLAYLNRS